MTFNEIVNKYAYIFYLTGYSDYNPHFESRIFLDGRFINWKSKVCHYVFQFCLYATINYCSALGIGRILWDVTKINTIFAALGIVLFLIHICLVYVLMIETKSFRTNLKLIHQHFQEINRIFENELHQKVSTVNIERNFGRKICIIIIYTVSMNLAPLISSENNALSSVGVLLLGRLLRIIVTINNLRPLLLVDLLENIIHGFCDSVGEMASVQTMKIYTKRERIILQMRYCKTVHYKLWKISHLISESFGWTIVMTFLMNSFTATNSMFWTFIFTESGIKLSILSK